MLKVNLLGNHWFWTSSQSHRSKSVRLGWSRWFCSDLWAAELLVCGTLWIPLSAVLSCLLAFKVWPTCSISSASFWDWPSYSPLCRCYAESHMQVLRFGGIVLPTRGMRSFFVCTLSQSSAWLKGSFSCWFAICFFRFKSQGSQITLLTGLKPTC